MSKPGFDEFLEDMGRWGSSDSHDQEMKWECTVSFGAAKTILSALHICYSEGCSPEGEDSVMRAIAHQHPSLVEEYGWLPWPDGVRREIRELEVESLLSSAFDNALRTIDCLDKDKPIGFTLQESKGRFLVRVELIENDV